jgi:hypothetical protein
MESQAVPESFEIKNLIKRYRRARFALVCIISWVKYCEFGAITCVAANGLVRLLHIVRYVLHIWERRIADDIEPIEPRAQHLGMYLVG